MTEFPFLQNLALVLGVAALTTILFQKLRQSLIVGIIFWYNTEALQGHVKAGAQVVIEALSSSLPSSNKDHHSPNTAMENLFPGLGFLTPIVLEEGNSAIGKTLAKIDLRSLTGASVIAITRAQGSVVVPSGNEPLKINDTLTLSGSLEAIEEAKFFLRGEGK